MSKIYRLPDVGNMKGVILQPTTNAQTSTVVIQYTDPHEQWCELQLPFLDAMYLLDLLKAVRKKSGFEMPT